MHRRIQLAVTAVTMLISNHGLGLAEQPSTLSSDGVVGVWQFESPVCGSSYGMGLSADGSAWLDEPFYGTWRLLGTRLELVLDEYDPGQEKPLETGIVVEAEILAFEGDRMILRWSDTGQELDAYRCPQP
ncbi:MAG: hypothetical protein AAFX92_09665 [Pseudomonadota bacterium]